MNVPTIELLNQTDYKNCPSQEQFQTWLNAAFSNDEIIRTIADTTRKNITLVIVNCDQMQLLNAEFRQKNYPTNVLSFPDESLPGEIPESWGDIVFCYETILNEANSQSISWLNHFAHLTIHGLLHLLGYDHENDREAIHMESLEIKILNSLNISNPY